jgi:hypothetical protein
MYCYYRIIRELYGVAQPNWTVGAARAGVGGTTSAFVTNECIRAIFAFENALQRTCKFFEETRIFYEYFSSLDEIITEWKIRKGTPLYKWANKSLEARWLDCQIATNPRNREMTLFCQGERDGENALLLPDLSAEDKSTCIENTRSYFKSLRKRLEVALGELFDNMAQVYHQIYLSRTAEETDVSHEHPIDDEQLESEKILRKYKFNSKKREIEATTEKGRQKERAREEEIAKFNRAATAHLFALRTIENGVVNAHNLQEILRGGGIKRWKRRGKGKRSVKGKDEVNIGKVLDAMAKKFYTITRRVDHVLEPSKQYLKWVLNRELAAPPATFDAGELVFAATSYGAINNWRL